MWALLVLAGAAAVAPAPAARSRLLQAGEARLYAVELSTAGVFRPALGGGPAEKLLLDVSGTLEVEIARKEGDAAVARLRLVEIGLRGRAGGKPLSPAAFAATKKTLGRGVLARLDADGRTRYVDAQAAEDPQGAEILRYLAAALQVSLPADDGATWVTAEADPTGTYDASYLLKGRDGGGFRFEKTKTGYREAAGSGRMMAALFSAKCDGVYRGAVTADGWPADLAGDELGQAFLGENRPTSAVSTTVKLKARGARTFRPDEIRELANAPMPTESQASGHRKFDPERLRANAEAALGSLDVGGIVARATELEKTAHKGEPELEIFEKVRAFAIVHPDRLPELEAALGKAGQSAIFYRGGMLALGQLGTPAAQALVRRQIAAKLKAGDWESNVLLLPLLTEPELPEEANEALLRSLRAPGTAPEVKTSAHLSLGVMAYQLRTVAPARANRIVDEYAAMLPQAKTREERSLVVDALANSASPRLPGILKDELAAPDEDRRAGALQALRLVRTKDSVELLVAAAEAPQPAIRRAAAEALVHYSGLLGPYQERLLKRLKGEPNSEIRQVLLRAMSDDVRRSLPVRSAVEAAAKDDNDPNVRAYAVSILKTAGNVMLLP